MKHFLSILVFSSLTMICYSQDFKAAFQKSFQERDTTQQFEILKKWEQEAPKDAELFTSYFNFYFSKSRYEVLSITTDRPEDKPYPCKTALEKRLATLEVKFLITVKS